MSIELTTKHESYIKLVQNESYDQEKEGRTRVAFIIFATATTS